MTFNVCQIIGCNAPAVVKHRGLKLCNRHYRERTNATSDPLSNWIQP